MQSKLEGLVYAMRDTGVEMIIVGPGRDDFSLGIRNDKGTLCKIYSFSNYLFQSPERPGSSLGPRIQQYIK